MQLHVQGQTYFILISLFTTVIRYFLLSRGGEGEYLWSVFDVSVLAMLQSKIPHAPQ